MKLNREQSTIYCGSCEDVNMDCWSQRMHLMVSFCQFDFSNMSASVRPKLSEALIHAIKWVQRAVATDKMLKNLGEPTEELDMFTFTWLNPFVSLHLFQALRLSTTSLSVQQQICGNSYRVKLTTQTLIHTYCTWRYSVRVHKGVYRHVQIWFVFLRHLQVLIKLCATVSACICIFTS